MAGHIRLGLTFDSLEEYMLADVRQRRRQLANPMAVRLGTGGDFSDYENWALHIAQDWREGVGKVTEDAAGYLFGEIESRVPEQLILPAALGCSRTSTFSTGEVCSYMPNETTAYSTQAVGGTGNPTRISWSITLYGVNLGEGTGYNPRIRGVAFYGYVPDGVELTAALYSNSAAAPNASVASGTATASTYRPGYQWYWIPLSAEYAPLLNGAVAYHWVIYPTSATNQITVVQGNDYGGNSYLYSGSAWVANTGLCPLFTYQQPYSSILSTNHQWAGLRGVAMDDANDTVVTVRNAENRTTGTQVGTFPLRYDLGADAWELVSTTGIGIISWASGVTADELGGPVLFDGTLYWPVGAGYNTWVLATNTTSGAANPTHLMASWAGYLWRAYNNQIWYAADAATWTEIGSGIGSTDYRIRGMAGLGANMYVSTDEALYYIAPGDAVVGIFPWGTISDENGRGMITHQGAIYIPASGRLWKFTEDGSIQDVWVSRDEDLPATRLGRISALASLNNMLVVGVNGTTDNDTSSVWGYTGLGWHHLATIPGGHPIRSLYYDRRHSRIWIGTDTWAVFYVLIPDWALNPYNDAASQYMPTGWVETDRIYGGSRELRKDVESLRAYGDFATGTSISVYWQDQGSTEWELLGTIDADGEELRWDDTTTRPDTQWMRIGLLCNTTDPTATVRLRAWVLKVMPMVRDRWRWDFTVNVADNQQMIGGLMNDRYADDMRDHLESLVQAVAPVLFEDIDGRQYWVKIMGAQEAVDNYENDGYGTIRYSMKFSLSLEQIESVFT